MSDPKFSLLKSWLNQSISNQYSFPLPFSSDFIRRSKEKWAMSFQITKILAFILIFSPSFLLNSFTIIL